MGFLQIASWNIEHLSGAPRAERKQSAFALADHIEMSGIDVIALQEVYLTPTDAEVRLGENQPVIQSRARSERRNADLDVVCYLLEEHLDDPWAYEIVPNRQAGDKSQLCAVMWNTKRLTLGKVTALEVSHEDAEDALWIASLIFSASARKFLSGDARKMVTGSNFRRNEGLAWCRCT
ncbi:hypothetical protein [Rhizobium mongolense]|uniref:hypothetical protein n=1 Tax=Rhizobium mongolense TaxID=57676 RepID=UPI0034A2ADBD